MSAPAHLAAYIAFWEGLGEADLTRLEAIFTPDIHFKDPFNDVHDVAHLRRVLAHMFATVGPPRMTVLEVCLNREETVCMLKWRFEADLMGRPWCVTGVSEIRFADDGRAMSHIDHWDAAEQFWTRIPGIGWLLRRLAKRAAVA